jgi:hypothetical protein
MYGRRRYTAPRRGYGRRTYGRRSTGYGRRSYGRARSGYGMRSSYSRGGRTRTGQARRYGRTTRRFYYAGRRF